VKHFPVICNIYLYCNLVIDFASAFKTDTIDTSETLQASCSKMWHHKVDDSTLYINHH